jgi:hypothetical protein
MAYDSDFFAAGSIGAGSGAPKIFTYITADTKATTVAADYFLAETDKLNIGDIIFATTDTGTTAVTYALYVTEATAATVTTGFVAVA